METRTLAQLRRRGDHGSRGRRCSDCCRGPRLPESRKLLRFLQEPACPCEPSQHFQLRMRDACRAQTSRSSSGPRTCADNVPHSLQVLLLLILSFWVSYYLKVRRIRSIHETIVALFAGTCVGLLIRLSPGSVVQDMISFKGTILLNVLLPPIILNSGYSLKQVSHAAAHS